MFKISEYQKENYPVGNFSLLLLGKYSHVHVGLRYKLIQPHVSIKLDMEFIQVLQWQRGSPVGFGYRFARKILGIVRIQ